jgi:saposin
VFTVLLDIEKEARDYGQISKEELASSKIPVHVERGNPLCSACQNFTTDALSYLSQKESQDKMMEVLHDACAQTFTLEKKVLISNTLVCFYDQVHTMFKVL